MGIEILFLVAAAVVSGAVVGWWSWRRTQKALPPPVEGSPAVSPATPSVSPGDSATVLPPRDGLSEPLAAAEAPVREEAAPQVLVSASLAKTRENFFGRVASLFRGRPQWDADLLEQFEEALYLADVGPKATERLIEAVQRQVKSSQTLTEGDLRKLLSREVEDLLLKASPPHAAPKFSDVTPTVWMIVGVNGAGKTTTIGKLAAGFAEQGKKVLIAAGDTFRAAAAEQLRVWSERAAVDIFDPPGVTDPGAVAYQALEFGKSRGFDVILIDTAGRLHTQKGLMEELKKVKRVLQKLVPETPHEVLLVLDANSGQNALQQAREFNAAVGVTGFVVTKLDGSAKGGVVVGLASEFPTPVYYIGVGEKIGDLRRFSATEFANAIV